LSLLEDSGSCSKAFRPAGPAGPSLVRKIREWERRSLAPEKSDLQ
jgi:hypothetical protein